MGQMRFYAPTPDALLPHAVAQAYWPGSRPFRGTAAIVGSTACCVLNGPFRSRAACTFPGTCPDHGQLVLSTCTLMERSEPYHLATELARGTLHRARTLVADLESDDVAIPRPVREELQQALGGLLSGGDHTGARGRGGHAGDPHRVERDRSHLPGSLAGADSNPARGRRAVALAARGTPGRRRNVEAGHPSVSRTPSTR